MSQDAVESPASATFFPPVKVVPLVQLAQNAGHAQGSGGSTNVSFDEKENGKGSDQGYEQTGKSEERGRGAGFDRFLRCRGRARDGGADSQSRILRNQEHRCRACAGCHRSSGSSAS